MRRKLLFFMVFIISIITIGTAQIIQPPAETFICNLDYTAPDNITIFMENGAKIKQLEDTDIIIPLKAIVNGETQDLNLRFAETHANCENLKLSILGFIEMNNIYIPENQIIGEIEPDINFNVLRQ